MSTISKAIASNTTADVYVFNNIQSVVREEPMPSWAGELLESLEALNHRFDQHDNEDENLESLEEPIPTWARAFMKEIDQIDMRLQKLESLDESNSWEDNSPQIEIPKEPINDPPNLSNFLPSNDYYPKDMTDYQYNEVRMDIPMIKEVDDPKEYFNMDMTRSLPKTKRIIRSNRIIRCFKCRKVGHVKANCSKMIIVMDDSNPLPTNDSKKCELEDEIYGLDKAISIKHVHIIHDIVLKQFASSYERYKTFIDFPRRYKILKQSDLVDIRIHPPKLLKISFKFPLKTMFLSKLFQKLIIIQILWSFLFIGAYLLHLLLWT